MQIGGRLPFIANQLDQSLWSTNQKQRDQQSRSYLLHSSLANVRLSCALHHLSSKVCKKCWAKTILLNQTAAHVLTFLHPILTCEVISVIIYICCRFMSRLLMSPGLETESRFLSWLNRNQQMHDDKRRTRWYQTTCLICKSHAPAKKHATQDEHQQVLGWSVEEDT